MLGRIRKAATRTDTLVQAFRIAYERLPTAKEQEILDQAGPAKTLSATLRAVVARFDRQIYPTPVTVRFGADDIETVDLGSFKLVLDKHDISVSAPIVASNNYEPHVRAVVERTLKKGMTAIDIGANVGFFTMLFASIVGDRGKVIAFEPNSENCRLILLSAFANDFANIILHASALSNTAGTAFFTPMIGSNGGFLPSARETLSNPNCTVVATARLDDLIREPVHFIKADIEGAEYLALSGGKSLIENNRPVIITEFSLEMIQRISGISGADFLRWMMGLSYRPRMLDRVSGTMSEIVDVDRFLAEWGHFGRIEDIVFVPKESRVE